MLVKNKKKLLKNNYQKFIVKEQLVDKEYKVKYKIIHVIIQHG